ncbi:MAG: FxsA family protein [Egibacteraceae bacterium]
MPTFRILLFVAFLIVPLLEIAVIGQVSQVVGFGWTLMLLLAVSIAGAALVRREGTQAWRRFRAALGAGRVPTTEVADGALVVLGGALMLTPGFLTDAVGLMLMVPAGRALARRALQARVGFAAVATGSPGAGARRRPSRPASGQNTPPRRRPTEDEVVEIEVVNIERTPPEDG